MTILSEIEQMRAKAERLKDEAEKARNEVAAAKADLRHLRAKLASEFNLDPADAEGWLALRQAKLEELKISIDAALDKI